MKPDVKKRLRIVFYWEAHKSWSAESIARRFKVSPTSVRKWIRTYQAVGDVPRKPRTVVDSAVKKTMKQRTETLLQEHPLWTTVAIAAQLNSAFAEYAVCPRTVARWLQQMGYSYQAPKRQPLLKPQHIAKRLMFALAHIKTDWKRFMFSDSKYFYCYPPRKATGRKRWCKEPPTEEQPKNNPAVHVYMGVTWFGPTQLIIVTGTSDLPKCFTNEKGEVHRGVCAEEYQDIVVEQLAKDGKELYANHWVLQQDGASVHTANGTKEAINRLVPGGVLEDWPPNSPDLNWIENIWAWMDARLRERPQCTTAQQLSDTLQEIWEDMKDNHMDMFHNCVESMRERMRKVIKAEGGYTGY
jgi:transposase